jgi:hypothetical protein
MGILDAFAAEDRVDVKFSTFYELVKGCAEREFITNGLKHKIPHAHILAMLGELPEPGGAADVQKEAVSNGND